MAALKVSLKLLNDVIVVMIFQMHINVTSTVGLSAQKSPIAAESHKLLLLKRKKGSKLLILRQLCEIIVMLATLVLRAITKITLIK